MRDTLTQLDASQLQGVEQTMLMTLYIRAVEKQNRHAVLDDHMARDIIQRIDFDFEKYFKPNSFPNIGIVIRSRLFDDAVQAYIDDAPDRTIVNLGVGLDTRFYRLATRQSQWYELDLPEVISLREKVVPKPPAERHTYIPHDIMDFAWIEQLPKGEKMMFVAEGLLMYFEEAEVKRLMTTLADYFPGSHLVYDLLTPSILKSRNSKSNPIANMQDVVLKWGSNKPHEVETWDPRLQVLEVNSVFGEKKYHSRFGMLGTMLSSVLAGIAKKFDIRVVQVKFN